MAFGMDMGSDSVVNIKVIGVGGAGNNVVNRMVNAGIQGVAFIAINTDRQALNRSSATEKIQIGEKLNNGKGAGGVPEVGRKSAEENRAEIDKILEGADMVFIAAGMGGGTGTGAAPVVAEIAKEKGILTIGVVTKPFNFEGSQRMRKAEGGIAELRDRVDSLVIIPNERLKMVSEEKITMKNGFEIADNVLQQAVQSISELIKETGFINLDFADVSSVMKDAGRAHMGVGSATGKNKAEEAAILAISSPLLETSISGARGVLINITGCADVGLEEVETAADMVREAAHPDANIIFGATFDDNMKDELRVTVIATGFDEKVEEPVKQEPAKSYHQTAQSYLSSQQHYTNQQVYTPIPQQVYAASQQNYMNPQQGYNPQQPPYPYAAPAEQPAAAPAAAPEAPAAPNAAPYSVPYETPAAPAAPAAPTAEAPAAAPAAEPQAAAPAQSAVKDDGWDDLLKIFGRR